MFYLSHHRMIFNAMVHLHRSGMPVDLVTLKDCLLDRHQLQDVGGEDYLIQVGEAVPSAANAIHYANIVREKWAERTLITRMENAIREYNSGEASFQKLFKSASELTRGRLMPEQFAFEVGSDTIESDDYMEGLYTGISKIDQLTSMGGIPLAQLTTVGAYSGKGKSFLLQQIVQNVAARGQRCAYLCFGADLDLRMLRSRWVKQACGLMPTRKLTDGEKATVAHELELLKPLPITVYESERAVDDKIETAIEWVEAEHKSNPFTLVVADYAQVMETREKCFGEKERMEIVAKRFGSLAGRLKCGVILASQMADEDSLSFRYSQQFIHSSGLAIVFQRDKTELQSGLYEVKGTVVKNRWGFEGGTIEGYWRPNFTRFEL